VLDAEQLGRMEQEAAGYPLRLLDVVRGCDVGAFLSRWEGSFKVGRKTQNSLCEMATPPQPHSGCWTWRVAATLAPSCPAGRAPSRWGEEMFYTIPASLRLSG